MPFDLGGTVLTGMNKVAYRNLRKYLGLPEVEIQTYDPNQQLARIDQDMLDRLEVDVRCVDPGRVKTPLTTDVRREGEYYCYEDQWGITWRMPVDDGIYFDMWKHPLANAETVADLKRHPWPDPLMPERFATLKERADRYVRQDKKAYVLGRHAAGILEISLWVRGFENFFVDMAANPDMAQALLDIITELKMKYWEQALETVGANVLIVSEADDIATQRGPLVSTEMYREFIAPRHRRLFEHIRAKAKARVHIFYHSCGAIKDLIPQLIDEGRGHPQPGAGQRRGNGHPRVEAALWPADHLLGRRRGHSARPAARHAPASPRRGQTPHRRPGPRRRVRLHHRPQRAGRRPAGKLHGHVEKRCGNSGVMRDRAVSDRNPGERASSSGSRKTAPWHERRYDLRRSRDLP